VPFCKDDAVTQLNTLGYDIVRYPKVDIEPLDVVIEHQGAFVRLGALPKFWITDAPRPKPSQNPAPNLESVKTNKLKGHFGIQALMDAIGSAGVKLSGSRDSSMQLVAQKPMVRSCVFAELADYIAKGEVNQESVGAANYMFSDANRSWLIIETIASAELEIVIGDSSNAETEATAKEVTGTLQVTAGVSKAAFSGNKITYKHETPLVFGFKTAEIQYDGSWTLALPGRAGKQFLGASAVVPRTAGRRMVFGTAD
jgi:hypothetical protein